MSIFLQTFAILLQKVYIMKRKKYAIHPDFKMWSKFNPPLYKSLIPLIQKTMRILFKLQKSDKNCKVEKIKIPFQDKLMPAIIYTPTGIKEKAPCLVYFHGGGFVLAGAPYHYKNAKKYAIGASCKVVFVDYPLAPKYRYPIPVDACYQTYKWVVENAETLSIDKNKVAVGGDSAGGSLSTTATMKAADNNFQTPCGQMLLYPAIGVKEPTKSMQEFDDTPMCNSKDFEKYCKMYFKNNQQKISGKYISPLYAPSLKIFPQTYIETAEFDCLRDEGKLFAKKLKEHGVKVQLINTKGTIHGYDMSTKSKIVAESIDKRISFLKKIFK